MPRRPRIILSGHPHHVTQRGVRRMQTFLNEQDYFDYLQLMFRELRINQIACWAWCLMPNHVHWLLVPSEPAGLSDAMREAHRLYAMRVNRRMGWRGHLWENRFWSYVMSEERVRNCARYIEQNPTRAGLVGQPEAWPWSSARAHLTGIPDGVTEIEPVRELVGDYEEFLRKPIPKSRERALELHLATGRPWGPRSFVRQVSETVGMPGLLPSETRSGPPWHSKVIPLDFAPPCLTMAG